MKLYTRLQKYFTTILLNRPSTRSWLRINRRQQKEESTFASSTSWMQKADATRERALPRVPQRLSSLRIDQDGHMLRIGGKPHGRRDRVDPRRSPRLHSRIHPVH